MNAYKLDDAAMDQAFLQGEIVFCQAVVREAEAINLKNGERIVVMLSNAKKYMGEVLSFTSKIRNGNAEGKLEIIRFPRVSK